MEMKFYLEGNQYYKEINITHNFIFSANGQSLAQMKEFDINTQTLYQLSQYLQVH
jgi:hypothetical protein